MVRYTLENDQLVIFFIGEMNNATVPGMEKEILPRLEEMTFHAICLDFSGVELISSIGLRFVLKLKMKYSYLTVAGITPDVFDVFYMTGFDKMLDVSPPEGYVFKDQRIPVTKKESRAETTEEKEIRIEMELTGINDTSEDYPYCSVIDLFEKQVTEHPDRLAVVTPSESLTYSQLDEMANRVAHSLLFLGVQPDDVIMILLPRGITTYIATLGILKAGAAYTVVNVNYPDDRIHYIYQDADCRFMISDKDTVIERLELVADVMQKRPLYMEELLADPDSSRPGVQNAPHDLCYLIYTSGSTGKPKGVMIEHGNLSNFVYPTSKNYEANGIMQKGTVLLAMAQMTFDVSVMEEYLGLTSGMTIAMATEREIMNPTRMKDFMLSNGVDAVCFTPAYANTLVSIPEMREAIQKIKTYDFGAEAFPGSLFTKIRQINPDAYIMNGYGPTEATISCTMKVIESPENITIGKPNANVYAFIINENMDEVPKGETGELLICGRGVGRGYRNLPEKSREAFVTFKGLRGYRTGDLARINENDEIEFQGRKDNQVKLRGLRIELDEVEKVIAAHPGVKLAAAKVFDNRILVGYYQLNTPGSVSREEIRRFAGSQLAHYMIPEVFVEVDRMPMTPNQKIDRKALEKPEIQEEEVVPPQNSTQEKLLEILKKIFPDTPVGITSNVYELGLSSLDTMLLLAGIEEAFQVNANFGDIADHPTVLQMEELVLKSKKRRRRALRDAYEAMDIAAFLAGELFEETSPMVFNLPYLFTMPLDVDPERLGKAVTKVLNAHDSIWARFECSDSRIMIHRRKTHEEYNPERIELSEEAFQKRREGLKRPFRHDGLLFRVEIYRTEASVYLFTDFHHSIMDADSYEILIAEILAAYGGQEISKESFSFFDLHDEVERYLEKGGLEKTKSYYKRYFRKAKNCNAVPEDREDKTLTVKWLKRDLPKNMAEITALSALLKTSPAVLFLGLTAAYNAKQNGCRNAYLNCVYNGRNDARKRSTVGVLSTSFPVFSSWESDTTLREYFAALQMQIIDSMGQLMQPFTWLLTDYPDVCKAGISYLGEVTDDYDLDGRVIHGESLSPEGTGGVYGIYEEIGVKRGKCFFHAEYRANEYEEDTVEKLYEGICRMLDGIEPDKKLDILLEEACGA